MNRPNPSAPRAFAPRSALLLAVFLAVAWVSAPAAAQAKKKKSWIHDVTANNLQTAVERAGWKVFGTPDRTNNASVSLGVLKGKLGCAIAVQVLPTEAASKTFELAMVKKGGVVVRKGTKVLAAICPNDKSNSGKLFDEVASQYRAGLGSPAARVAPARPAVGGATDVRGVTKANLESRLAQLGWKRVGAAQEFNPQSLTLPITKGNIGGAASFAYFDDRVAVKAFVDTIAKQDGAAWLNIGGGATLVVVLPGKAQMARDLLASLTGAPAATPARPAEQPGVGDVAMSGVSAFRIHQITPASLKSKLEGAGWNLLGRPKKDGGSITVSINRGVISGAASLKVFNDERSANRYEKSIRAKADSAVIRSGNKILAVVLPGNRGEAVRLLKALLSQ